MDRQLWYHGVSSEQEIYDPEVDMAKIKIEPSKAKAVLGRQNSLENTLKELCQDVDSIRSGLRYKIAGQENIGLIMDVPLEVTVELGRTSKSISEILDFAPGTIIELDKIAGEPIDILVNGKLVAKGEVVVIEESFGVRITEIIK